MKSIHPLLLVCLLLLCACAGTDIANRYYGTETYPPKEAKDVAILTKKPDREFIVIADFQARGETPQQMQKRAAEAGADAVIVTLLGGFFNSQDQGAGKDSLSWTYSRIVGTAIKYK